MKPAAPAFPEEDARPKARYGGPKPHAAEARKEAAGGAKAAKLAAADEDADFSAEPAAAKSAAADHAPAAHRANKHERAARTGREQGKATLFFNVGRKHLATPADIVGKIAGVTRLPASVVGAIDIHQRHMLVDVDKEHAPLIIKKLAGIRLKGEALAPALAGNEE
jgi:ATP-dependent RNA helicase DeaD